jgi:hypothetical protein
MALASDQCLMKATCYSYHGRKVKEEVGACRGSTFAGDTEGRLTAL